MIGKDYLQVNEILRLLLETDPSQRSDVLEKLDITSKIREEVAALLALEHEVDAFMTVNLDELTKDIFDAPPSTVSGQRIGVFEVIGELGSGGMGAVYLAKRADGKFDQKVALKLLRREFNVEQIRRYFDRESQIQAKLEHPNIARLLDVGTTSDGVPFIVMEYVDAVRVDDYCEDHVLSVKETLKLFNKICQAVAHAHHHLIIHRDLKPSNILITEAGEPKLLDFGISKLLDPDDLGESTELTAFGAMTPEYAAPEQINGEPVSTAADIYSLGVVLYKMLTGGLPIKTNGKRNGDLLKLLSEAEPTPPSYAGGSMRHDARVLKGDIDNIVLKALNKEPDQRYRTVEEFSADVWRHLDGQPVAARAPTFLYQAQKFINRNRISVIASALVLLSLISGIAVAIWQAREARAHAANAIESQSLSDKEREKAEKISRFLFKVFGYGNPAWFAEGAKFGGNTRVIDAMDDLSGRIDIEFADQADVQSELHHKFAEAFSWTASFEPEGARKTYLKSKAKSHLLRGFELRKQFYGEWHELVAKDLYYNFGNFGSSDSEHAAVLMKAIEMMRSTNPENVNLPFMLQDYSARLISPVHASKHEAYRSAVKPETNENKFQIAERFLREALPIFRLHYADDAEAVIANECLLSFAIAMSGRNPSAMPSNFVCENSKDK